MFKKHMTPLTKNGTLSNSGKNPAMQVLPAARGGTANMNSYAKATPMAQPAEDAAPANIGLGSGSFTGNGVA